MKRNLFLLVFCTLLSFNAIAGYLIRGVYTNYFPDLKNYTLTTDVNGVPISAASMNTSTLNNAKNSIVIVRSDITGAYFFPIAFTSDPYPLDVEVRDFHYDREHNEYVLCGSRETDFNTTEAFVAVIDNNFTSMDFVLYPEADVFYSIVANFPLLTVPQSFDYYVCGKSRDYGVIASINRTTLQFNNFYITDSPWEYHKIIVKKITSNSVIFVSSGRVPGTHVGFTTFNSSLGNRNSYMWAQNTEPHSLCVVTDYPDYSTLILASSYQNKLSLHPIFLSNLPTLSATHFTLGVLGDRYYLQDISVNVNIHVQYPRISVVGFMTGNFLPQRKAWYGYLLGLSWNVLENQIYFDGSIGNRFEHHKIRYGLKEYTGGYFQSADKMCVLFGSPINPVDICDYPFSTYFPAANPINPTSFTLSYVECSHITVYPFPRFLENMDFSHYCDILKGGSAPGFSMLPPEKEIEITNFYDRITVKDTPLGTNYQIYSVTGQLIQTGTTNPDISTTNLSKGMYILRLETGKAFKFVK